MPAGSSRSCGSGKGQTVETIAVKEPRKASKKGEEAWKKGGTARGEDSQAGGQIGAGREDTHTEQTTGQNMNRVYNSGENESGVGGEALVGMLPGKAAWAGSERVPLSGTAREQQFRGGPMSSEETTGCRTMAGKVQFHGVRPAGHSVCRERVVALSVMSAGVSAWATPRTAPEWGSTLAECTAACYRHSHVGERTA